MKPYNLDLQYSTPRASRGYKHALRLSLSHQLLDRAGISHTARVQFEIDHDMGTGTIRASASGPWRMSARSKRSWFQACMRSGLFPRGTRIYLDVYAAENREIVFALPEATEKEEEA